MKFLDKAYCWMLEKAKERAALAWLSLVSCLEGFISPIPPDPMLAIMSSVNGQKFIIYSLVCTLASVIGGCIGFLLGTLLYDSIGIAILNFYGYSKSVGTMENLNTIAFAAIAFKAFTPIPYKVVSIIAGFMNVNFFTFVSASVLSRFIRFFIVSALCKKYGELFLQMFAKYKLLICIIVIIVLLIGFALIAYV